MKNPVSHRAMRAFRADLAASPPQVPDAPSSLAAAVLDAPASQKLAPVEPSPKSKVPFVALAVAALVAALIAIALLKG
jgi:hypothetical protein